MNVSQLFTGSRVRLAAPRPEDAAYMARWYEDSDFARQFDSSPAYPRSPQRMQSMIDEANRDRNSYPFSIRLLSTDELIGYAELEGIQWTHRLAWLAIAIGDPIYQGQGYGYEAMTLVLRYAFDELNLHRIQLTVFSYNPRAIRLYEKLGFKREGVFREALLRDGERHHMYLYGLLAREWKASLTG